MLLTSVTKTTKLGSGMWNFIEHIYRLFNNVCKYAKVKGKVIPVLT
jgi:hypothetical protein